MYCIREDLSRLTTLTTCIKETLRICPPVLRIRRELSRDMVIDGRSVLAGTQVVTDIYKVHHNPTVWTDPEVRTRSLIGRYHDNLQCDWLATIYTLLICCLYTGVQS